MRGSEPPEYATDITADDVENIEFFLQTALDAAIRGPFGTDVQRTASALVMLTNAESAKVREAIGDHNDLTRLTVVMDGWNRLVSVASKWEDRADFEAGRWQHCMELRKPPGW